MPHTKGKYIAGQGFAVKSPTTGVVTEVIASDGTLVAGAAIDAGSISLAKLAAGITPSHVIKFVALGSTITTTALAGLAVGDLVIRVIAATSTVTAKLCATAATLPDNPEDADYLIVLRAAA